MTIHNQQKSSLAKTAQAASQKSCFKALALTTLLGLAACGGDSETSTIFELKIENISSASSLTDNTGQPAPVIFSGGVGAVHKLPAPIYTIGQPATANGLEDLAEDGVGGDLISALQTNLDVSLVVATQTPEQEGANAGLLGPGQSFRLVFNAEDVEAKLSLALAFLQANDLVVGTSDTGISLFNSDGSPRSGDLTSEFNLLDVGTEVNQQPGSGDSQTPRQTRPDSGAAEGGVVRPVDDGFSYPSVPSMLRFTLTPVKQIG